MTVELAGAKPSARNDLGGLAVVLCNGRRIEVQLGFDAPTLRQVVNLLERV